tara:strand:+ start:2946 stop:3386 length:441 start_codon:yes stop_codon:yes gene_type:complete
MNPVDQESLRYLILDGHSIINSWSFLYELHRSSKSSARQDLIRRMTNYQDITEERVVIVFDGRGQENDCINEDNGIQIFYSKSGITADQIIERLSGKYSRSRSITVASRDKAVLDTCSSFGANVISPKTLEELLETAEDNLRKRLI